MKINLTYIEKIIIRNLPEQGASLRPYTLFIRFRIPPFQLAYAARNLKKLGLVEINEDKIGITKKGFGWLIQNRHSLRNGKLPSWKEVPCEFKQPQFSIDGPYIPQRTRLHKSLRHKS